MTRRHLHDDADQPGQDSFLDIVANIVGILIILVLAVGVRASRSPANAPTVSIDSAASPADIAAARAETFRLGTEVRGLSNQAREVKQEIAARRYERESLLTGVRAIEAEMERRRESLDEATAVDYDLRIGREAAQAELDRLMREQLSLQTIEPDTVQIENLPTPLSRTVTGPELTFQLRGGRVTWIPLEDLLTELKSQFETNAQRLTSQPRFTGTVGPLGGFRLRYQLERIDKSTGEAGVGPSFSIVRLAEWELVLESPSAGESLGEAMAAGSRFRLALSGAEPQRTTVTLWTYPDSFDLYRQLRQELFELEFATAGRPLPADIAIGGSPQGTKSAAQ
ncbi:MAG: hypothetical protein WDZ59_13450 [Pirellulales bacterium]